MAANKPVVHGPDHHPRGADPVRTERWHKCGDTDEPALGAGITGKAWFRLVTGPWNHRQQSLEVVIAVDGGSDGDIIFTLPAGYFQWADGENVPGNGQDTTGGFRAFYIDGTTGDVILGPMP